MPVPAAKTAQRGCPDFRKNSSRSKSLVSSFKYTGTGTPGRTTRTNQSCNKDKDAVLYKTTPMSLRAFILSLFLFVLPGVGYAQTVKEKLRVGLGSISFHSVVFPLGRDAGIFAKHGLDIEPIYIGVLVEGGNHSYLRQMPEKANATFIGFLKRHPISISH